LQTLFLEIISQAYWTCGVLSNFFFIPTF